MGFTRAVGSVYANYFNVTGRARRAEYWWFFLFQILVGIGVQIGCAYYFADSPELLAALNDPAKLELWLTQNSETVLQYSGYFFAANLLLLWVPNLTVTIRRLHDTNRSGWMMLLPIPAAIISGVGVGVFGFAAAFDPTGASIAILLILVLLPLLASIYVMILLCLPGSHGNNRFGPDPIPNRKRKPPAHPAFADKLEGADLQAMQALRKQEISEYYRSNVLTKIQRS